MPDYLRAYREQKTGLVHQKQVSVENYTLCRSINAGVIDSLISHLLAGHPSTVLETGVGNGRIFLPLLEKANGTKCIGVDISQAMIDDLKSKLPHCSPAELYCADLRDQGFFKDIQPIDVIYSLATLHIISEHWKSALDNMVSTTHDRGTIILAEEINAVFHGSENMYEDDDYRLADLRAYYEDPELKIYCEFPNVTENIEKIERFFRQYHALRDQNHVPFKRVNGQVLHGDQSPAERHLRSNGLVQKTIQSNSLRWLKPHSFEDILYAIEQGTVTTLGSDIPEDIRKPMRLRLETFCLDHHYDLEEKMLIPSELQLHTFYRDQ